MPRDTLLAYYRAVTTTAYIEQLRLCPFRPPGPLPRLSTRLLELVRNHGALEPVVVRQVGSGEYEILGNVAVWMAAQRLRLERVPIHILTDVSDQDAADIVAAESTGYAIDAIDEAEFLGDQLEEMNAGANRHRAVAKLAYLTGHQRTYISHSLRLLKLPVAIQEMVRSGRLSAGHGRALLSVKRRDAQLLLAKRAIDQKLSVREVESLARERRSGARIPAPAAPDPGGAATDPDTRRLESTISEAIGCKTTLNTREGSLTISYHDLDILEGVLQRLGVTNF